MVVFLPSRAKLLLFFLNWTLLSPALADTVTVPLTAPSSAKALSRTLVSFSLEPDRWVDWIGQGTRNSFFFNILDNLNGLSGEPPRIRIGGNSEDLTVFDSSVQFSDGDFPDPTPNTPYPDATTNVVGDNFYQLASSLPSGTTVTWGVNFGQLDLTAASLEATAIACAFTSQPFQDSNVTLEAIEIGNEADLYTTNGDRNSSFNVQQYASQFSQHHHSGTFCTGTPVVLQDLMSKSNIRSNLTQYAPDIAAVKQSGLTYVLGETNSISCHGAPGVSDTAGALLWALDYTLFASQLGIKRVYFHNGIGFRYNFIQPVTLTRSIFDGSQLPQPLPPHIQPSYYAAVIAAEAIGPSGFTGVVELEISEAQVSGYAFFEGAVLARAVFINLNAFTSGTRGSVHIDLDLSGSRQQPTAITAKRLSVPTANATEGITWGGQTYETADGKVAGTLVTEAVDVGQGFDISDTEVVMLTFA
ncbi:glycoside hydrolase family 79 protein [Lactarius tabidus]